MPEYLTGQFLRETFAEGAAHRSKARDILQQTISQKPTVGQGIPNRCCMILILFARLFPLFHPNTPVSSIIQETGVFGKFFDKLEAVNENLSFTAFSF